MTPVYLGRFAPLHLGHQKMIDMLINNFGISNIIIMIGSSNIVSKKTPYTFSFRNKLIKTVYPEINTIPIPDFLDDKKWLNYIESLETKLKTKFIFFGGNNDDLKILSQRFGTKVLIDRSKDKISATQVREALARRDTRTIKELVDERIYELL